nr:NAD-dependent epimerase/dehydratase family protein [Thermomonas flagellata]
MVTGGSGFLAGQLVAALLARGEAVHASVRDPAAGARLQARLAAAGIDPQRLRLFTARLEDDAGWDAAVAGCDRVLHVASPFPARLPRDPDALLPAARGGTLRVLHAAARAGVRRVVLTSSFAAVGYGHPERAAPFGARDWSSLDGPGITAYVRAKTLAEQAAWTLHARLGQPFELVAVNPVLIVGPPPPGPLAASLRLVRGLLRTPLPLLPRLCYGVVDVRDVADLHLRALAHPQAPGRRFIASAGEFLWLAQLARHVRAHAGRRGPVRELPDALARLLLRLDPGLRPLAGDLSRWRGADSTPARALLGWQPRGVAQVLADCADGLIRWTPG